MTTRELLDQQVDDHLARVDRARDLTDLIDESKQQMHAMFDGMRKQIAVWETHAAHQFNDLAARAHHELEELGAGAEPPPPQAANDQTDPILTLSEAAE